MRINEKIVYKIPTSIYVIFFAISIILTMIAYGFSAYIDKIEVGDVADWYHTVINICPQILKISEFNESVSVLLLVNDGYSNNAFSLWSNFAYIIIW